MVRGDNATPHQPTRTEICFEGCRFRHAPQRPYSPDISPCDLFRFGDLKMTLKGEEFEIWEELQSRIEQLLGQITPELMERVRSLARSHCTIVRMNRFCTPDPSMTLSLVMTGFSHTQLVTDPHPFTEWNRITSMVFWIWFFWSWVFPVSNSESHEKLWKAPTRTGKRPKQRKALVFLYSCETARWNKIKRDEETAKWISQNA
jgi:hypothetical protein